MSEFNRTPGIRIAAEEGAFFQNWDLICRELNSALEKTRSSVKILVVETYVGVLNDEILSALLGGINTRNIFKSADAMLDEDAVVQKTFHDVTDDRIFGYLTRLNLMDFFDPKKLEKSRQEISNIRDGVILIYGIGASLLCDRFDILVYADMARWEIQQRMRKNEVNNLGVNNALEDMELKYKRGFFVDWRVCDRHKKKLMNKWDYVLDTNTRGNPRMLTGTAYRNALDEASRQPFSLVPYFDPGIWGGQWMKDVCKLEPEAENYAWCFNCVPEENSLLFIVNTVVFETPAINLVFYKPVQLLGDAVHGRFGDEFPIRFDFLDTMEGGNLSLQVHPLTEYIQEKFGMAYTQDESYYILDAKPDARVYLGLREDINPREMQEELIASQSRNGHFEAENFVASWPAKKHDHFLIPGGTIHCSGKNSMVLEISATPYIFTFKLWDWDRVGLDGKPRPINIGHGLNVIQWDRTASWVKDELVNRIVKVGEGKNWVEEKTGLHEREFIETRRHWFTGKVTHHTNGGVNVLNLVDGDEVIIESVDESFSPFIIHYAETFIVPACIGEYTIRPHGPSEGKECATVKAYVRTNA
jgi:mannose-6-phosphate isomerase class I